MEENDEKVQDRNNKKNTDKIKWVVVIALFVIAIFLIYNSFSKKEDLRERFISLTKKSGYGDSLEGLTNAPSICIVEDVDGVVDPVRKNIFTCGVNLASSSPQFNKSVYAYAFEFNKCFSEKGERSVDDCINEIKNRGCFVFYLEEGESFESYENMIIMGVGEELGDLGCKIQE